MLGILHELGYNIFQIPKLTLVEINSIIKGISQLKKEQNKIK